MRAKSVLVLGFIVFLAACGGSAAPSAAPASSPASPSAKPASSAGASAAAASGKPAASTAGSAAAKPAARGPVRIGVLLPLTGPQATVGKDHQDGLNLYLKSVNNTIAGRPIELIFADSQFQADVALTKARELVENQHVAALMGFTATPEGYAVAQYVKDSAHIPMLITSNAGGEGMTTDPKFKSPYLTRWTQTATEIVDVSADWSAKQGFKKGVIFVDDYAAGVQNAFVFASTFIRRGGSIVQEVYAKLGTTDYGPQLAQLKPDADVLFAFLTGADGLRFGEQYPDYVSGRKLQVVDSFGSITAGPNLVQLKAKAAGIASVDVFSEVSDDPGTQAFVKAWKAAYPDRLLSHDAAGGFAGGQILAAAMDKANGQIENVDQFMQALYGVQIDTAKGPVKLDANHDIVQTVWVYGHEKSGDTVQRKLLASYPNVSDTWIRTPEEVATYPKWESFKDKWVGMTKDQLEAALK
ncbi:MAG TPA: ABC transporter substrate-binding protein [Chloroflexota bacterium]|nr:ABC transporter substrate-binding protein [Chloroflexota bacterium]